MAYPAYVREKARELRLERRLSIVEIAERLALPKTTIFYWVRDIPLGRPRRENPHPGTRAMQRKFRGLREQAYLDGLTRELQRFSRNRLFFSVQYHTDQNPRALAEFWASTLEVPSSDIRLLPKANSGKLRSRTWRCEHGVMAVTTNDTLLRARLQAWMDCVQEQWVDSPANGA
jgi:transposase-like protein